MKYCTNCGHDLAEGLHFCTNCGQALDLDSTVPAETGEAAPRPPAAPPPPAPPPPAPTAPAPRAAKANPLLGGPALIFYAILAVALLALLFLIFMRNGDPAPAEAVAAAPSAAEPPVEEAAVAPPPTASQVPTQPANPTPAPIVAASPVPTPTTPPPSPTPEPKPTSTPAPSANPTSPPAASPTKSIPAGKGTPAAPVATATAIPATPTPTTAPTPVPTPGIWGIAVADSAAAARQMLESGSAPATLSAGSKPYAAITIGGFGFGTRISYVWDFGPTVIEGAYDTRTESDVLEIAADIDPGLAGGGYVLILLVGDSELLRHEFQVDTANVSFGAVQFAEAIDAAGRPLDPTHDFARGTWQIQAVVTGYNVPAGSGIDVRWIVNGAVVATAELPWPAEDTGPGSARTLFFPSPTAPGGLAAGDHRFIIELNGVEVVNDVFRVG